MSSPYTTLHDESLAQSNQFWMKAAEALAWDTPPSRAVDINPDGTCSWFSDGTLNSCFNAVDRHVLSGNGDTTALRYVSAMTGDRAAWSYSELCDVVSRVAGMIAAAGVSKGDRVLIYMPMIPQAVFAMLACARIGAIHSVVFGGFAAAELAKRIDDARPSLILTASCGIEPSRVVSYMPILEAAFALCDSSRPRCIVFQREELEATLGEQDLDWTTAFEAAKFADCVPVAATDPLYILYTSGTTGIPKGVVHDNGGHAVGLHWSVRHVYGLAAGETMWAASDIGWAVGHCFIVYGPLFAGCTTLLYEGKPVGTPDAGMFWRTIRDNAVDILVTAPTAIRAIKREDPEGSFIEREGSGPLRGLFLAGERADPDTLAWTREKLGIPVIDHWWQTELGYPALATCVGLGDLETRPGSAGRAVPGYDFGILDAENSEMAANEMGDIAIRLPLPPGSLIGLWNNPTHFAESYLADHPGYYTTGDAGSKDEDGFVYVTGRIDDIINVAGHRLSTGSIEQIVSSHPSVAECAAFGITDELKGMIPVALIVLKRNAAIDADQVCKDVLQLVREMLGPVAALKSVATVEGLPKTRSGKILRRTIRQVAEGEIVQPPATLDDVQTLVYVADALDSIGCRKHLSAAGR